MRMMVKRFISGLGIAVLLAACGVFSGAGGVLAAADKSLPSATDLLFETPHIKDLPEGTELVYDFSRKVSEEALLGPSYDDTVKVTVGDKDENSTRSLQIDVFTGKRKRDPQDISGMTGNPVLVFYLDRAVFGYNSVAGGKRAYLKNRFRIALGEAAELSPVKVRYDGKTLDGYRVVIKPYEKDLNRDKMRGYENSRFEMVVSDGVPGHFVAMKSEVESDEESAPDFVETLVLKGAEVVE